MQGDIVNNVDMEIEDGKEFFGVRKGRRFIYQVSVRENYGYR